MREFEKDSKAGTANLAHELAQRILRTTNFSKCAF